MQRDAAWNWLWRGAKPPTSMPAPRAYECECDPWSAVLRRDGITDADAQMIKQLVRENAAAIFGRDMTDTGVLLVGFAVGLANACAAINSVTNQPVGQPHGGRDAA